MTLMLNPAFTCLADTPTSYYWPHISGRYPGLEKVWCKSSNVHGFFKHEFAAANQFNNLIAVLHHRLPLLNLLLHQETTNISILADDLGYNDRA
jgi:hypothetical protein